MTVDHQNFPLQKIIDDIYDEQREISKQISELEEFVNITTEEVETFNSMKLHFYNIMYNGIEDYSDAWKKDFLSGFIEAVDIFEDDKEHGRWVKHIRFKLPIAIEDNGDEIKDFYTDDWCDTVNHDETVVLLANKFSKAKDYIEIGIDRI